VEGDPKPKGSFTHVGKGRMRNANKGTKPWQGLISLIARSKWVGPPLSGPVRLDLIFYMKKPKNPRHHIYPIVQRNDLDKLERTVFDALSEIAYGDDGQVIAGERWKLYENEERPPGVFIRITELS